MTDRRRSRWQRAGRAALAAVCLLLAVTAAARAAPPPPPPPSEASEVILVVDGSGSMARNDPSGTGAAVLKAILDFAAGSGGRISVVKFGGWNETEGEAVLLPPIEVPSKPDERRRVLQDAVDAVTKAQEKPGRASDFNAAFERAVNAAIDASPGAAEREILALVLSDGVMEVIEGSEVRAEYEQAARASAGLPEDEYPSREDVTSAALSRFEKKVLPELPERLRIAVLWPGTAGAGDANPPVLKLIAASGRGGDQIIKFGDRPLREVLLDLLSSGLAARDGRILLSVNRASANPGEPARFAVPQLEGMRSARALVLADRTDYSLSGEGAAADRAAVFGQGQRHRIVDLAGPDIDAVRAEAGPAGTPEMAIVVEAPADAKDLGIECLVAAQMALGADVLANEKEIDAGGSVTGQVFVRSTAGDGGPLTDPRLLPETKASVQLVPEGGTPDPGAGEALTFRADKAQAALALTAPADIVAGSYDVVTTWEVAIPGGGPPAPGGGQFVLGRGTASSRVLISAVGTLGFDAAAGAPGEPSGVTLSLGVGRLASEELTVTVTGPEGPIPVPLAKVDDATYRGTFAPADTGDYALAAQSIDGVPLRLSVDPEASALAVKVPIDALAIYLAVVENGKPRTVTELDVAIEPEPGKGKNVRIDFLGTTGGAAGARCAEVKLEGSAKDLEAKLEDVAPADDGSIKGTLLASYPTPAPDAVVTSSEQTLKLVVTARLGEEQKQETFSVRLRLVSPMDQKIDQRLIIGAAVLGGLLLLLIVVAVVRRKKPEEEDLIPDYAPVPSSLEISDEVDLDAVARAARAAPPAPRPKPPPPKPKPAPAPAGFSDATGPGTRRPSSRPDHIPPTQVGLPSIPPGGKDRKTAEIDAFFDGDDGARRPISDDDDSESIYVVLESGAHPVVGESSDDETDLDDDDDRPLISGRRFARRRLTSDDLPAPTESDRLETISDDDDSRIDEEAIPEPRESLRVDPETGRPRRDSAAVRAAAARERDADEELQLDFEEMLGSDEEHGIRDEDL